MGFPEVTMSKTFLFVDGIFRKLFQKLLMYMPNPHAKFHQNWCSGFWEKVTGRRGTFIYYY